MKTVIINGQKAFSKETGEFWGNVNVKEGLNTVIVSATDLSGNMIEHTFNIVSKQDVAGVDIIPAADKEGKNYMLLIASQNYKDIDIPSLEEPIPDAVRLKMILKNSYNFNGFSFLSGFLQ